MESLPTLIDRVENDWDSVLNDLHRLHQNVIKSNDLTVGLTSESCDLDSARQGLTRFVRSLPTSDTKTSTTSRAEAWRSVRSLYHSLMENHSRYVVCITRLWKITRIRAYSEHKIPTLETQALPLNPVKKKIGIVVPTQVNYVSLMGSTYGAGEIVPGSTLVASRLLSRGFLWDHVRVMGGAYGSFFDVGQQSGSTLFGSYRDPNILDTLNIYQESPTFFERFGQGGLCS